MKIKRIPSKEFSYTRRRFLGAAVATFATPQFGMASLFKASGSAMNSMNSTPVNLMPNNSFETIKQINAGVLSVGYAEAGSEHGRADANGAPHADSSAYAKKFSGTYKHQTIKGGVGHNLPQESPKEFADAVIEVDRYSKW